MKVSYLLGVIIVIVAIAIVAVYISMGFKNQGNVLPSTPTGNSLVALQLTDPPIVPAGTQALFISYNSLEVHAVWGANSGWIQSNSTGSINLLSLLNLSQTIGTVGVPSNAMINLVRFDVSSANITINGTTYNVTLPSGKITAQVFGDTAVNSSGSVLLSLSPTIVTILTSNNTVFVMVPSVRAVILANGSTNESLSVGHKMAFGEHEDLALGRVTPNITITGASLSVAGNNTMLSITVRNNANQSVLLRNAGFFGNLSSSLNSNSIENQALQLETALRDRIRNGTVCVNQSQNTTLNNSVMEQIVPVDVVGSQGNMGGNGTGNGHGDNTINMGGNEMMYRFNSSELGDVGEQIHARAGLQLNGSVCTSTGFVEFQNELRGRFMNMNENFRARQMHLKEVHFIVAQNGTLLLPYSVGDFNNTGYTLQAGQSYTFSFNGMIVTSDGGVVLKPVTGDIYTLEIGGERGANAQTTTNAIAG